MVDVQCRDCGVHWGKRRDSLKAWAGRCNSCATRLKAKDPRMRAILVANGTAVMARVGRLPHYPDRNYKRGADHYRWQGGITPAMQKVRLSAEMRAWVRAVRERDNYTCCLCRKRGGDLHVDHIKPFALHPELRFDMNNGRTLCVPCHRKYGALVCNGVVTREAVLSLEPAHG